MTTSFLRFTLLLLCGSAFTTAQPASDAFASSGSKVLTEVFFSSDKVRPGSDVKVGVLLVIEKTWHINSHAPTYDYLIGTTLEIEPMEGVILSDIRYPEGDLVQFGFAEEPLSVYDDSVTVFLTLRISENLAPGEYAIPARLRVQACNDQVCLAPSTANLSFGLMVAAPGEEVNSQNRRIFAAYETLRPDTDGTGDTLAQMFETEGSLVTFFAIFLVGLALNLTPCVYPMLSVTVSLFGTQTEAKTSRVFIKAFVYVMGIAAMYSVLGVTAALSGGLFGSWLQNSWVLAGIGVLLFALALSMFGVYQLQAPYWLTSKLGGTIGTGFVSLFVSGLVVGIFAAPCIGPPVIALLALVGQKGDPLFGFWAFFVLSLGLGLPYLILGTFSGLLSKVPRSGPWLIWVERIFGVILTGAALFYLSLAFFPAYAAYVVPLILIVGGVYLGFLEPSGKEKPLLRRVQWAFGIASIVVGGVVANALREPGVTWQEYDPTLMTVAQSEQRPVMIDFYADWCIPCLELDHRTFTDTEVITTSGQFVRLKVDLTHFDSPEAEAIRKQFNIAGVPTIVFVNRDGREERSSRVVGYVPPDEFLERMKPLIK